MKISIITSTFNAADLLPYTIASLREQTSTDFEWLVIDGASTDGTVDLVNEQLDNLPIFFISEPDQGIYDAWNKACASASGDWLLFLGAGDVLASATVIADITPILEGAYPAHSIVYGNMELLDESTRRPICTVGSPWEELVDEWEGGRPRLPAHPATFQHFSLFKGLESFDTSYKIAGDSVFLLQHIKNTVPLYVNLQISNMLDGGVSTDPARLLCLRKETARAVRAIGLRVPLGYSIYFSISFFLRKLCYKILRRRIYLSLISFVKKWLRH